MTASDLATSRPLTAALHPNVPSRSALAAAFSSFVVRVHTRHGIRTLTFDALAALFTSTAKQAAAVLGISSRTLIRVCRSLGIRRWPYLGFRSEKNAERVRMEAVDNLRRRLEKRGGGASPADAVLCPDATGHRGASAKRLLQVRRPCEASSTMATGALADLYGSCSDDDGQPMRSPFDAQDETTVFEAPIALVTPHALSHGFHLDLQRISPRKAFEAQPPSVWVDTVPSETEGAAMPSLHLLVDASLLTSVKASCSPTRGGRMSAEPPTFHPRFQPRNMSMRDILSSSPAVA